MFNDPLNIFFVKGNFLAYHLWAFHVPNVTKHCISSLKILFVFVYRNRSDRCDELKRLESAYLALQDQVEDVEHKNEQLERKKGQSLFRYVPN